MGAAPIRLALADDHPTLLKGIEVLFVDGERFQIVALAHSADEAANLVREKHPDILIIDLSMPGDVYGAIRSASRGDISARVVVFTAYANIDFAIRAFDAGAGAFVLKGRPSDDLYDAIAAVMDSEIFVSPGFSERLAAEIEVRHSAGGRGAPDLSRRERQLVQGLLKGMTNREIALDLGLSEKTIKHYMTNVMIKLGAKNRLEVALAVQRARTQLDEMLVETEPTPAPE
jgi:DNA-binding NarL/FixJ family response regulator